MNPDFQEPVPPIVEVSSPSPSLAADYDPYVGVVLDERYKIVEFIGAGGWSNVYRGEHLTLGVSVAIKIIHKHLTRDEGSLKRLQQEALSMSRLESPFIVRIMDYGISPSPYIVMEYFDGVPLDKWLKAHGFLRANLAIELFKQICQGLINAHTHGLVHRDLKPSNIMLRIEDNQIKSKILDFGIAKWIETQEKLTSTGEILGSPPYMSPEQWKGQTDNRSDIYSLGCIMYEVLSAKPAFSGEYGLDYLAKHFSSTPSRIRVSEPLAEFPEALEDLIGKCLEKAPADRYQSAEEVLAELERVRSGRKLLIWLSRERQSKKKKLFISVAVVLASLSALCCWQRETFLDPWFYHFNAIADSQKEHSKFEAAIENYRMSLLAANSVTLQNKPRLHALRMLAFCLRQQKQFREAAELQKQVDQAIGIGPWPEFTNLLRRLKFRLFVNANKKKTLELAHQTLRTATAFAGKHSIAYSQALEAMSNVMRSQGEYQQALQVEQESLAIAEDLLEPDSLFLAERLNNLGEALKAGGDPEQAEKAYSRALEICSQIISGPDSTADGSSTTVQPLVLADFDSGARINNLEGDLGTWEKDASDKSQGVKLSFAADDARGLPAGKCLQLDYDVDSPNQAYNGFFMKLEDADFSSFDTLNLYLKGDASRGYDRRVKIELKDFSGKRTSSYLINGVSDKWQKFSIPFDKFKLVSDWSHMNEFVVVFEDIITRPKTGRIYLDCLFVSCTHPVEGKSGALTQMVGAYNGLASARMQKQDGPAALAFFEKAYQLCQLHREIDSLPVLINMTSFYKKDQDRQKHLDYWRKALDSHLEESCSKASETEILLSELGEICCRLKEYEQAEAYFEAGYIARVQTSNEDSHLAAILVKWIEASRALNKASEVADLERVLKLKSAEKTAD